MSLLTEQEITGCWMANGDPLNYENYTLKEYILRSSRAIESLVIAKIKAQGPVAYISPSIASFAGVGNGIAEFSYRPTGNRTIPLYKLPEGD